MRYLILVAQWEKYNLAESLFAAIAIRAVDILVTTTSFTILFDSAYVICTFALHASHICFCAVVCILTCLYDFVAQYFYQH